MVFYCDSTQLCLVAMPMITFCDYRAVPCSTMFSMHGSTEQYSVARCCPWRDDKTVLCGTVLSMA